jgi:hypothetical protein
MLMMAATFAVVVVVAGFVVVVGAVVVVEVEVVVGATVVVVGTPAEPAPRPVTAVGTDLVVVVPSPICPLGFQPQHETELLLSSAHEWSSLPPLYPPEAIPITPEVNPVTCPIVVRLVLKPSPSAP